MRTGSRWGVELYLARRYLLRQHHGAWGWMIGVLATASVAIGVMALIITLSVMTGFREDIRAKILGVQPHILLTGFDGRMDATDPLLEAVLSQHPGVGVYSPYINGQVLIGRGPQSSGALLKGVDPAREPRVANLEGKVISGDWPDLAKVTDDKRPSIFLGKELARNIGARIGEKVWIITPGSIGISALSIPKAHIFELAGIVESGLYDYDSSLAYIHLPQASKLFGMGRNVSGIGVRTGDAENADRIARDLQDRLKGKYWVRSWISINRNLFSALRLEKAVMFTILILVTLVASVMIVSNLLLSISQKTREIGILRAMGATAGTIRRIFLLQGFLMGVVGTAIGTTLGVTISLILSKTNLVQLPADVYYIDHLPVRIDGLDITTVVVAACLIVLIATLYPAHRATRIDPLDAIRYG